MADEQAALAASFSEMMDVLAPQDTSYRIGIVSTDAHGFQTDCCGDQNPLVEVGTDRSIDGARGNCQSCVCAEADSCFSCDSCDPVVQISRPHDGTKGRLLAAFDPEVFKPEAWSQLSPDLQSLLPQVFPEDISGSVAVIDRETMKERACEACGCADCFEARSSCEPLFPGCISISHPYSLKRTLEQPPRIGRGWVWLGGGY